MNKRKKTQKAVDFQRYLTERLKNHKFRKHYDEYGKQLEIGYKILQLRKQKRISQLELAKKLKTQQSNIARIETGKENLSVNTLEKIANALNCQFEIPFGR